MNPTEPGDVESPFEDLVKRFFRAVSFESGNAPHYADIHGLFIEQGLLIKNVGSEPEISTLQQFIEPRQTLVSTGVLTRFHEAELSGSTAIFGKVAHRFSAYTKSGVSGGAAFDARGMVATQFIRTPRGWRISAMAWDDERPGLKIPD